MERYELGADAMIMHRDCNIIAALAAKGESQTEIEVSFLLF